jgi:hypothetical protein
MAGRFHRETSEAQLSPVHKTGLRGKVAQGAAMSHNLQQIVLVTFAVAGIFLAFFIS